MTDSHPNPFNRMVAPFMEIFGLSRPVAVSAVVLIISIVAFAFFWFFHSAPPKEITITTGPAGSSLEHSAQRYREILASNGVSLNVLRSEGSLQNLHRLRDPVADVDVGFVQGRSEQRTAWAEACVIGEHFL